MTTSTLLHNGIDHLRTMLVDLARWMEEHEYESIKQKYGSVSQKSVAYPAAFEPANCTRVLQCVQGSDLTILDMQNNR